MSIILGVILAGIYFYCIFQIGSIQKGNIKNGVAFLLVSLCTVVGMVFSVAAIGCLVATVLLVLFDLFYDEESFRLQWRWIVLMGISTSGLFWVEEWLAGWDEVSVMVGICLVSYLILSAYRQVRQVKYYCLVSLIYLCALGLAYVLKDIGYEWLVLGMAIGIFAGFEMMMDKYRIDFEKKTTRFQQELLINQYEEVKTMYLNMRGFRHDYHNHIQVLKAHLYMDQIDLIHDYLLQLEGELESIDASIQSGNLMLDAILNSKMAVAKSYDIQVICKAEVPEVLPVTDIDLCVILGNLLDNAIESCQKIEDNRFIRIYITIIKNQLYISIQNAAKEELNFNEKHYISSKRGNHGLGMKRVQVLVDKYEGYLNLQNEPGIFAAEVTCSV